MSKEQVVDKGIRQKSTKRVNSFIVCSAFCPGSRSKKRLRVYTSGSTTARQAAQRWRQAPGHTHRNWYACLKVLRLSMGKTFACIYDLRCELVKERVNCGILTYLSLMDPARGYCLPDWPIEVKVQVSVIHDDLVMDDRFNVTVHSPEHVHV